MYMRKRKTIVAKQITPPCNTSGSRVERKDITSLRHACQFQWIKTSDSPMSGSNLDSAAAFDPMIGIAISPLPAGMPLVEAVV
jgi:hypothetical protein